MNSLFWNSWLICHRMWLSRLVGSSYSVWMFVYSDIEPTDVSQNNFNCCWWVYVHDTEWMLCYFRRCCFSSSIPFPGVRVFLSISSFLSMKFFTLFSPVKCVLYFTLYHCCFRHWSHVSPHPISSLNCSGIYLSMLRWVFSLLIMVSNLSICQVLRLWFLRIRVLYLSMSLKSFSCEISVDCSLKCLLYNSVRDIFIPYFKIVVVGNLKSFFRLDQEVEISHSLGGPYNSIVVEK